MAKTPAHTTKPHAFLFTLGPSAAATGNKRLPAAYAETPCYWFRSAHEKHAKHLAAIDEPEVSAKDTKAVFTLLERFLDDADLRDDVYTDQEIYDRDDPDSDNFGFHPGVTLAQARAALERGGFVVLTPYDTHAKRAAAGALEQDMALLAFHLDYASLELGIASRDGGALLTRHLERAWVVIERALYGFDGVDGTSFVKRLTADAAGWSAHRSDALHLLFSYLSVKLTPEPAALARQIVAGLPAPRDARVKGGAKPARVPGPPAKKVAVLKGAAATAILEKRPGTPRKVVAKKVPQKAVTKAVTKAPKKR